MKIIATDPVKMVLYMETKYMCASVFVCVWNDKRVLIKDLSKVALYPDTNSFHLNSKYIPWIFFLVVKRGNMSLLPVNLLSPPYLILHL